MIGLLGKKREKKFRVIFIARVDVMLNATK